MSVAPSFQSFEMLTEPYEMNGKKYVRVRNPKTGTERQVRWYEDKGAPKTSKTTDPYYRSQKDVLGFEKGYITIFKGETYPHMDWFRAAGARYTRWWGWYFFSTKEIPADIPEGLTPIRLDWDLVKRDEENVKTDKELKPIVESLLYEPGKSIHIGTVGQRLELFVKVIKAIPLENHLGNSIMHIMEDADENVYMWTTSAKSWEEGSEHHIKGTVKSHSVYKGEKETILIRCTEVK